MSVLAVFAVEDDVVRLETDLTRTDVVDEHGVDHVSQKFGALKLVWTVENLHVNWFFLVGEGRLKKLKFLDNLGAYLEVEGQFDLVTEVSIVQSVDNSIGFIMGSLQNWNVNT